ncbi:MAG: hypothetical protein IJ997_04190 [Mycoplasmataceae bacterium]|nr:hypothetical protein [Mycoplasmataceae bacterium]
MSVVITGKTLDNKDFTITSSNMSSLATTYKNTVKNNKLSLPDIINVVYYGNFVILCPNYTFAKGKVVPGNGGFTQITKGGIITKINVTSTEFPISIINNNYVVILSKTNYTPKIVDTDKIYLSKVSPDSESSGGTQLYSLMYTAHGENEKDALIIANHNIITISDIYDNTAYTIANICNNLAALNNTYSFDIHSGTSFTFYYGITSKTTYIPILFTNYKKYKNIFTKDYLDFYFNYYSKNFNWWYSTFCQTIDLNTTADNVTIRRRVFFGDGSKKDEQSIFTPTTTPYTMTAIYCPADGQWDSRSVGEVIKLKCPTGYIGTQKRRCGEGGVWEEVEGYCYFIPTHCPATDVLPETEIGKTVNINCPTGYTGVISKFCDDSGIWIDKINTCKLITPTESASTSPTTAGTSSTTAGTSSTTASTSQTTTGTSPTTASTSPTTAGTSSTTASTSPTTAGTSPTTAGTSSTTASTSPTTASTPDEPIPEVEQIIYCPADGIWLQTDVGNTLLMSCPSGYTGQQSRTCLDNGIWSDIDSSSCIIIEIRDNQYNQGNNQVDNQGDQNNDQGTQDETEGDQNDDQGEQSKYLMWIILSIVVIVLIIIFVVFRKKKTSKQSKQSSNKV